jgi:putative ABC transport system permease protein
MGTWFRVFVSRVRGCLRAVSFESEFDEELQTHLAMLVEENIGRGMTPAAAERAARVKLGGVTQIRETQRAGRGLPLLDTLWQDARYALRLFRKSPGFTLVAVSTIGIGIGVNTTVFTVVNAVALKPLPVADPAGVVRIERWFESRARGDVQYAFSFQEYTYLRAHNHLLSTLIAAGWPEAVAAGEGGTEFLQGQVVSDDYFASLGISAIAGRTFLPEDNQEPGAHPVVVLADGLWRRRFQSDPHIAGRVISLNGVAFTIVGVAPPEFIGTGNPPQVPDFWAPLMMQAQLSPGSSWLNRPGIHRLQLLARVKPGALVATARAELQVLAAQLTEVPETHSAHDRTVALSLQPAVYFGGTDDNRFRQMVALLMAAVSLILLVACANLANMLLARGSARQKEIGMRLALGASRSRIIRQLLTESLLLAAAGGVAGVLVSVWASQALWKVVETIVRVVFLTDRPFVASMHPDGRILAFGLVLSVMTGLLFGVSPALTMARSDLRSTINDEGSTLGDRVRASRLRGWLISGQMAVSVVCLVCGGLFMRGLISSQTADAGFDTRRVFMVFMNAGADDRDRPAVQKRIMDRLSLAPHVQGVALVDRFPFGGTWSPPLVFEDARPGGKRSIRTLANYVSPTYFQTAGIPITRGRTFTRAEVESAAGVAIVSESTARRLWPDGDSLGRRFDLDLHFTGQLATFEVVGVASDVRTANLSRIDPAYVYLPTRSDTTYNLMVRSDRDTSAVLTAVRGAVEAVDRTLGPSVRVASLNDGPMMHLQRLIPRVLATFVGTLAAVALILATIGIYGVTSYTVSQRTHEIGIRMALGANAGEVQRLLVIQGMVPAFVGGAIGLLAAGIVSTVLRTMLIAPTSPDLLFGIGAFDAATFVGLSAFVVAVAVTATYIPVRRATRVDPLVALRYE